MNSLQLTEHFQPRRLWLLLKRDLMNGYKGLLIAMASVGGAVILISMLKTWTRSSDPFYTGFFGALLFIGGYIVTSLAFRELHQNGRGYLYLTLPGSLLEKLTSKLLITSLGYALGCLVFMSAVSGLSEGINRLIFDRGHALFNPFSRDILFATAFYLVTQSVFLLGSVCFRKLALLKTVLALNITLIAFSAVIGLFAWLISLGLLDRGIPKPEVMALFKDIQFEMNFSIIMAPAAEGFLVALRIIFWGLLAPAAWTISYLRLGETEV